LLVLAILGLCWQPGLVEALRYDRGAILQGEWWRLVSGHFVHGGAIHGLLNLLGLGILLVLLRPADGARALASQLLLLALLVSAGLWWLNPELERYLGFSGVLHGLFALHVTRRLMTGSPAALLTALLLGKLLHEQAMGPAAGTAVLIGMPVAADAHIYGALAGILLSLIAAAWTMLRGMATARPAALVQ
jgi:rhomboid family GlyGly-CTERM serine protease